MLDNFTLLKFDKKSKKINYNGLIVVHIYNIIQNTSNKDKIIIKMIIKLIMIIMLIILVIILLTKIK